LIETSNPSLNMLENLGVKAISAQITIGRDRDIGPPWQYEQLLA
jgi:hypothetical protein